MKQRFGVVAFATVFAALLGLTLVLSSCSSTTTVEVDPPGSYNALVTLPGNWTFTATGVAPVTTDISATATSVTYAGEEFQAVYDSTKCTGLLTKKSGDTTTIHKLGFVMTSKTTCSLQEEVFVNGLSQVYQVYAGKKK